MTGKFIHVVHQCNQPDASAQGIGSVWECECGKQWQSYETTRYGYYAGWFWSNRPPVIFQAKPTRWQRCVARIKGENK